MKPVKERLCSICKTSPAEVRIMLDEEDNHEYEDIRPCIPCAKIKRAKEAEERKNDPEIIAREQKYQDSLPLKMQERGVGEVHCNAKLSDFSLKLQKEAFPNTGLYIHGDNGTGKTHLAAALFREDYRLNVPIFLSLNKLFRNIKATYEPRSEKTESEVLNEYIYTRSLYIDDLGAEKLTEWGLSILYAIIDDRYTGMRKTIITSNLGIPELKDYAGARIASRIKEMCRVICLDDNGKK